MVRQAGSGLEVFMARRSARSAFLPDAYVFPGGAVEPADGAPQMARFLDRVPENVGAGIVVAALRELFEEAGMLFGRTHEGTPLSDRDVAEARHERSARATFEDILQRRQWQLCASRLVYYSRWLTPPIDVTRRFDTHFFIAEAEGDSRASADAVEMHDGVWVSPAEALARGSQAVWTLVFPTLRHLERLTAFSSLAALRAHTNGRSPQPVMPIVDTNGAIRIPPELEKW
ncbi:MAG: NUDIX domain-containing protein [Candidatus Eremiobacteraeota bacterium]|nr:NUDIX domain-containing protein [Candidatus Eremiobacteraeota bacterium]